jgi:hypothetical protein
VMLQKAPVGFLAPLSLEAAQNPPSDSTSTAINAAAYLMFLSVGRGVESQSGARGWRGYEADDDEILFFCPACSKKEFEGD